MRTFLMTFAASAVVGGAAMADGHEFAGDVEAGENAFNQCQTCHVVVDDAGETLAGRNARTGPNLYNIMGRTAGTVEGFRYSDSMVAAGEAGLEWNEEEFVKYVQDPTGYLREYLDDSRARGKMSFKVRSEDDAADLAAFLNSLGAAGDS